VEREKGVVSGWGARREKTQLGLSVGEDFLDE
jgi:hypothetical protein